MATLDSDDLVAIAQAVWANTERTLTSAAVVTVSPRQTGKRIIIRGQSYLNADGNAIQIVKQTGAPWPVDITSGWAISFAIRPNQQTTEVVSGAASITGTGTAISATSARFDLTAVQTSTLTLSGRNTYGYDYAVVATKTNSQIELESGVMMIVDDVV